MGAGQPGPGTPGFDNESYMKAMGGVLQNPQFMEMAEKLGQQIMSVSRASPSEGHAAFCWGRSSHIDPLPLCTEDSVLLERQSTACATAPAMLLISQVFDELAPFKVVYRHRFLRPTELVLSGSWPRQYVSGMLSVSTCMWVVGGGCRATPA